MEVSDTTAPSTSWGENRCLGHQLGAINNALQDWAAGAMNTKVQGDAVL